jgi:hypothetical protein
MSRVCNCCHNAFVGFETIDYDDLTRPISRAEAKAFRLHERSDPQLGAQLSAGSAVATAAIALGVTLAVLGAVGWIAIPGILLDGGDAWPLVAGVPVALIAVIIGVTVAVVRRRLGSSRDWLRWQRLSAFATTNRLGFTRRTEHPGYPGELFSGDGELLAVDQLHPAVGRNWEIGNLSPVAAGPVRLLRGRARGYVAVRLDRTTPERMEVAQRRAADLEFERANTWLILSSRQGWNLLDVGTLRRLFALLGDLGLAS